MQPERGWRHRTTLVIALVLAASAACAAFGSEGAPTADDRDAGDADGASPPPALDAADASAAPCSRRGEVCALYEPDSQVDDEYPFAITTDETSVFWLALTAPRPDEGATKSAASGVGIPRVWRVRKDGSGLTLLYQGDKVVEARAIAMSGDAVHFVQRGGTTEQVTLDRACTGLGVGAAPCIAVRRNINTAAIVQMVPGDGASVWLLEKNGVAWRSDATTLVGLGHSLGGLTNPDLERSPNQILLGGANVAAMRGYSLDGGTRLTTLLFPAGLGAQAIAGDDAEVFALLGDKGLWRGPGFSPEAGVTRWVDAGDEPFTDMVVDTDYLYLSASEPGGVYAFERTTGRRTTIGTTSVLRLAADARGVYWGDHRPPGAGGSPGAIHRFVK